MAGNLKHWAETQGPLWEGRAPSGQSQVRARVPQSQATPACAPHPGRQIGLGAGAGHRWPTGGQRWPGDLGPAPFRPQPGPYPSPLPTTSALFQSH